MRKEIIVIIALVAVGFIFFTSTRNFALNNGDSRPNPSLSFPSFSFPGLDLPESDSVTVANEAWQTLQSYLEFAKNHNLAGVRSLSHQISPACSDPAREKECFDLMDSVYALASDLEPSSFKHIQKDDKQVAMYTDGPLVLILYFTRAEDKTLKILAFQACVQTESGDACVNPNTLKNDDDRDGWWNTTETLFY